MSTPVEHLAEYLTGPDVGFHSIALSIPDGPMRLAERAKRFFALREVFGIKGYDDQTDALAAIRKTLSQQP